MKFRVHVLATLLLVTFVVVLSGVFLYATLQRFEQASQEGAEAVFAQIVDANARELQGLIGSAAQSVDVLSALEYEQYFGVEGRPSDRMLSLFKASLEANRNLYGAYFGADSDEFIQVIGIHGDATVTATLDIPGETAIALRRILLEDGVLVERWEYFDTAGALIGERVAEASYRPTGRPWYLSAQSEGRRVMTPPYMFQSSGELGVTLARSLDVGGGVLGVDLSLRAIDASLAAAMRTQPGGLLLLDDAGRLLGLASGAEGGLNATPERLSVLSQATSPALRTLGMLSEAEGLRPEGLVMLDGEPHVVSLRHVEIMPDAHYTLLAHAPLSAFDAHIVRARDQTLLIAGLALLISMPLAYGTARRAASTLIELAEDSEKVKSLDFSGTSVPRSPLYELDVLGQAHTTMKCSIRERTQALSLAKDKLESLVRSGLAIASERDADALLSQIMINAKRISTADAVTLFMTTERKTLRFAMRTRSDPLPSFEIPLFDTDTGHPNERYVSVHAVLARKTVIIDDVYEETRFDVSGTKRFDAESGYHTVSMLNVPLITVSGEVIGVLQLINATDPGTGSVVAFDPELVSFVEALAAQGAMAIDNQHLLEGQRHLMDALIKLVAGAIDAKSPYTGGHCERVPELAIMLAHATERVESGPLAGFRFETEDAWREFRIGAWLHDCGKVTTPEYVVDKATKLETLYNRIHEIRMRFEVLLRDAEIRRLTRHLEGEDPAAADAGFEARRAQLIDDFAFVAECNLGGEFMADAQLERIRRIADQTWLRHFDDRLGLSQEEARRHAAEPAVELPAVEGLLADKSHHRVLRVAERTYDPKYGFRIKVPELEFNFGEIYNLSIRRGTLTEEERFKINEHIIQTIIMLDQLPLPPQLRRIPEYAGTHHETLTGSGYPCGLTAEQLSIPARIMAIADIFEALTASDRPYKPAKSLSESIRILSFFAKDQHIDADLFRLFLSSGVYLDYARRYLQPDQIDCVDVASYLQ